jgi:hypothetical protein
MTRRLVTHGGADYLVNEDDALPPACGWWALIRARVVDEITGEPPRAPLTVSTTTANCTPRVDGDGNCGLVGRPADVGAALTTPGALTAEIRANGFLPRSLTAAIDAARRRLSPAGAAVGDVLLQVTPPDPVPASPGQRVQFRPGRGVILARTLPPGPEEFALVATPLAAPASNEVPLTLAVQAARPVNTRLAGVPLVLPDQPLHRAQAAALRGRVIRQAAAGASPVPAPAAVLDVMGLWWTLPEVRANSLPPHAPNVVSVDRELTFEHPAGASLEYCTLMPDMVVRTLAFDAYRGASELRVANWAGLNPAGGSVLQLGADNSAQRELVVTSAFAPPTLPASPARIPLGTPLSSGHAVGTPAMLVTVTSAAATTLEREAQPGDRVVFGVNLAGVPANGALRIAAGTVAEELCFVRRLPTLIGPAVEFKVTVRADGTFEFPALARIAQLRIRATHPGQTDAEHDLALDYGGDNTLEILLKP